jgi:multicomponent Na+:H+ antiporter subunit E
MVTIVFDAALRSAGFAALWWVLNRGDMTSWQLGAPTVVLALLVSFAVLPPRRWTFHPIGVLRFALYFLQKSLISSIDVSSRVLRPQMPLKPGMVNYTLRLPPGIGRVIMSNATSLLPGTLGVDLRGDVLVVNALDVDAAVIDELRQLEEHIAGMMGVQLIPVVYEVRDAA